MATSMHLNIRPGPARQARSPRAGARFGRRSAGAFTLLEVVIVLTIVSAVSTVGIIRYANSLARYRVDAAAQRLVADLRQAQVAARTSGSSRTIRFNAAARTYTLMTAAEVLANTPKTEQTVDLKAEPYGVTELRTVGLIGTDIKFDGYGQGNRGCVVVITVGKRERTVVIEASLGRAYVNGL